ncbi:MAG: GtrA family protein [Clostridia bacterium]|nr:GtrA family protein [Clostridia bacterium]
MIGRLKSFYEKHKEIISYLFFGVVTTVVSLGAWYLTMKVGVLFLNDGNGEPTTLLDAIGSTVQWVVGVAVAFITNKKFVFTDAEKGLGVTLRQLLTFTGSRVLTYFMEMGMNIGTIWAFQALGYRAFEVLGFCVDERIWAKAITAVAVTIANYVISKLFVFRKKSQAKEK